MQDKPWFGDRTVEDRDDREERRAQRYFLFRVVVVVAIFLYFVRMLFGLR